MQKNLYLIKDNENDFCVAVRLTKEQADAIERFITWSEEEQYEIVLLDQFGKILEW